MESEEFDSPNGKKVLAALAVVFFAWGSLWSGTHALQLVRQNSLNANNDIGTRAASAVNSLPVAVNSSSKRIANDSGLSKTANDSTPGLTGPNISNSTSFKETVDVAGTVKILFGGDVMLDRGVRKLGEENGYASLFADLVPLFKEEDLVVANLEGTITDNPSKTLLWNGAMSKELTFTFDPKTAPVLAEAGFSAFSLANNHSDNFGRSGVAETRKYLEAAGLKWFGDPGNLSGTESVVTIKGLKIALVGYNSFDSGLANILSDIRRLSAEGDFVIVMPHWGEEYQAATDGERDMARQLIAAGAKAIIGSHPHVVQDQTFIGDVPVFYSLGNLLFDQYFSPQVMSGELVELDLVPSASGPRLSDIKIRRTSTASRQGVQLVGSVMDFWP